MASGRGCKCSEFCSVQDSRNAGCYTSVVNFVSSTQTPCLKTVETRVVRKSFRQITAQVVMTWLFPSPTGSDYVSQDVSASLTFVRTSFPSSILWSIEVMQNREPGRPHVPVLKCFAIPPRYSIIRSFIGPLGPVRSAKAPWPLRSFDVLPSTPLTG